MKEMSEADLDARHAEKMRKKKAARDKILATKTIEKGLLIVHTGKGKGKSTAAFGMVFRMLGHGEKVAIVQFVKGKWQTGERPALRACGEARTVRLETQVTITLRAERANTEPRSLHMNLLTYPNLLAVPCPVDDPGNAPALRRSGR